MSTQRKKGLLGSFLVKHLKFTPPEAAFLGPSSGMTEIPGFLASHPSATEGQPSCPPPPRQHIPRVAAYSWLLLVNHGCLTTTSSTFLTSFTRFYFHCGSYHDLASSQLAGLLPAPRVGMSCLTIGLLDSCAGRFAGAVGMQRESSYHQEEGWKKFRV